MGNESEKLAASGARIPGVRDEVERLIGTGELRAIFARANLPAKVADTVIRAFTNAKVVRSKYVSNGEIRQALERAGWTEPQIVELFYSESIVEFVAKTRDDALAKKIEKSIVEIEVAAKTLVEKANCVHSPVSVHDSPLVCVKCGAEYTTSIAKKLDALYEEKIPEIPGAPKREYPRDAVVQEKIENASDLIVTTSLDLQPKTYDEKTRRAIFDALDSARVALDYLSVYVVDRGTQDGRRVSEAERLVGEAMAIVEGGYDWHSGG